MRFLVALALPMLLSPVAFAFEGSTLCRLCKSSLRGAIWPSSEVVIAAGGMVSWDRSWDDTGAQV